MRNVLTQAEIDALVKAVSSGQVTIDEIRDVERVQVKRYDFRRPNKFSKAHINALAMIHENFGRILASYLSTFLRNVVDIQVASVEQLTFEDYIVSVDTTLAVVMDVNDQGNAILELSLPVVFPILEIMLGGPGSTKGLHRPLTELEMSMMQNLTERVVERYNLAWNEILDIKFRKTAVESNPRLIYSIAPNEIVALVTMVIKINEASGFVNICLPHSTLEKQLGRLSGHSRTASTGRKQLGDNPENLYRVPLTLQAVAGKFNLTVKELLEISEGDVIMFNKTVDDTFELYVEEKLRYKVQAGHSKGRKAVQVISVLKEES